MAQSHVHAGGRRSLSFPPWYLQGSCRGSVLTALPSAPSTLLPSTPLESPLCLDQNAFPGRSAFASRRSRRGTVAGSCLSSASLAMLWTAVPCTTGSPATPSSSPKPTRRVCPWCGTTRSARRTLSLLYQHIMWHRFCFSYIPQVS
jgi:hypothetical protein